MEREKVFSVRLTAAEWAEIQRAARLADRTEYDWARRVLLRVAKSQIARKTRRRSHRRKRE